MTVGTECGEPDCFSREQSRRRERARKASVAASVDWLSAWRWEITTSTLRVSS